MRTLRGMAVAAGACVFVMLAMPPALANPDSTRVQAVFQMPCQGDVCESGANGDPELSDSAVVAGVIQIHVGSKSVTGLQGVELQARAGSSGSWTCVKRWNTSSSNFNQFYNWNTTTLPGDCPDGESVPTSNGLYQFRVRAWDRVGSENSSPFGVRVNNRPRVPSWAAAPKPVGLDTDHPRIELRFTGTTEPDVREYHFIRTGPDGSKTQYAISASNPGGQGCDLEGSVYVCDDDAFPSTGYSGRYTYELMAYRSSPRGTVVCELPPSGPCIESDLSSPQSVQMSEPPRPSPSTSTRPTPSRSASPSPSTSSSPRPTQVLGNNNSGGNSDWRDFYTGEYDETLPYEREPGGVFMPNDPSPSPDGDGQLVAGGSYENAPVDYRRLLVSLAGGLVLMLVAGHIARVLRLRDAAM